MVEERIRLAPWLVRKDTEKFPIKIWHGWIERESVKAVYVYMWASPGQDHECMKCGKALTHPVSKLVGLGPECGKHYYKGYKLDETATLVNTQDLLDAIRSGYQNVRYSGWLPKRGIKERVAIGELLLNPAWRVEYEWRGKKLRSVVGYNDLQRLWKYASVQGITLVKKDVWGSMRLEG